jgi:hypothetical protein
MAQKKAAISSSTKSTPARRTEDALANHLHKTFVKKLDQWVESTPEPDQPIIGSASGKGDLLSPRDIVKHVKKRTPTGEKLLENWVDLIAKHVKDAPLV